MAELIQTFDLYGGWWLSVTILRKKQLVSYSPPISVDTVNMASRMESSAVPNHIQCSEAVQRKLRGLYTFETASVEGLRVLLLVEEIHLLTAVLTIDAPCLPAVKGIGIVTTYLLTGAK